MNESPVPEVMRGSLEECLRHWAREMDRTHPKGSHGSLGARKPLADFCGVSVHTASDWVLGKLLPKGETWFHLALWLQVKGYRVVELEQLTDLKRNFAELIGLGICSAEEAAKIAGYSSTSQLYRTLREDIDPLDSKATAMWDFWKSKRAEILKRREELGGTEPPQFVEQPAKTGEPVDLPAPAATASFRPDWKEDPLLDLMIGLTKYLERLSAPKQARALHRARPVVFRLSARLTEIAAHMMGEAE